MVKKNILKREEIDKNTRGGTRSFNKNVECRVDLSRAHAVALLLEGIRLIDWFSFFQF